MPDLIWHLMTDTCFRGQVLKTVDKFLGKDGVVIDLFDILPVHASRQLGGDGSG